MEKFCTGTDVCVELSNANAVLDKKQESNLPKPWPSERIAPGGLFHSKKVEYSKETADLIKLLMREAKVSMMVRKQVHYHLRNGEPLTLPKREKPKHVEEDQINEELRRRSRLAKRKNLNQILASGAYDMPQYRLPPNDQLPSDKAKKKLQEKMSGVPLADLSVKPLRRPRISDKEEKFSKDAFVAELLDQINERVEWFEEMTQLGEAEKYRVQIRDQIAERLRRIKALDNQFNIS